MANASEAIWLTVDENSTTNGIDFYYTDLTATLYFPDENFVLNITSNNTTTKTIKGTFSGTIVDEGSSSNKKTLTEGVFDVKY